VTITGTGLSIKPVPVDHNTGRWSFTDGAITTLPSTITVKSPEGGDKTVSLMCPIQPVTAQPAPVSAVKKAPEPTPTKDIDRFRAKPPAVRRPK
jgi:hypothetical protein